MKKYSTIILVRLGEVAPFNFRVISLGNPNESKYFNNDEKEFDLTLIQKYNEEGYYVSAVNRISEKRTEFYLTKEKE